MPQTVPKTKTKRSSPGQQHTNPIVCGPVPRRRNWRKLKVSKLTRAERNMRFIEAFCRIPEGPAEKVGQPIVLAQYQEDFFYAVYDNEVMTRTAILSMARKNAKTATIAALALVHIAGPEAIQNSRISSGARSKKQAAEVYNYASKMAALSPRLRKIVKPVPSGKKLIGLLMNVEYEALAAEGSTAHGGSPVVAILDEVGQVKGPNDDFFEAIITSQGAYDNPLLIVISTQAPTDAAMLSVMIDDAERSQDPSIVCHVYRAPDECEIMDEKAWAAANPAMGLFRSRADVEDKARKAVRMPSTEGSFRVLYLNQRVNMNSPFVAPAVWKKGNREPRDFVGRVYGGLDLSSTTDLTSLVLTNRRDDDISVLPFFWMPHDTVLEAKKRDKAPYDVWVKKGLIRTTPGKVLDYDFIARDIGVITADLDIAAIGFDRWRMDRMKAALERQEVVLPLVPFGQGFKDMSPALDALEEDLLKERLLHGGNPVLAMCAANAVAVEDPAENRKLDKVKATGRIDGMVALAMAEGVQTMKADADTPVDDWIKSFA